MTQNSDIAPTMRVTMRKKAGGDRYSRFVARMKRVLPITAIALLLLVGIWPRIQYGLQHLHFTLPRLDPRQARDLRMLQVRYTGVDRQNRPFTVTADAAQQSADADDLVGLEGPKADLTTASGNWLEASSYTGTYQPKSQLLDLFGNVALFQDRGDEFHSDSARVNLADNSAEGHDPTTGQGSFGHVEAEGFQILDHGATIIFTGHAHLELVPHEKAAP